MCHMPMGFLAGRAAATVEERGGLQRLVLSNANLALGDFCIPFL